MLSLFLGVDENIDIDAPIANNLLLPVGDLFSNAMN
jgi:hypothetical protein